MIDRDTTDREKADMLLFLAIEKYGLASENDDDQEATLIEALLQSLTCLSRDKIGLLQWCASAINADRFDEFARGHVEGQRQSKP